MGGLKIFHLVVVSSSAAAWVLISVDNLSNMVVDALTLENALIITIAVIDHLEAALEVKFSDTLVSDLSGEINQLINLILLKVFKDVIEAISFFIRVAHLFDGITSDQVLGDLSPKLSGSTLRSPNAPGSGERGLLFHHSHVGGAADIWARETTLISFKGDPSGSWWDINEGPVRLVVIVATAARNA